MEVVMSEWKEVKLGDNHMFVLQSTSLLFHLAN